MNINPLNNDSSVSNGVPLLTPTVVVPPVVTPVEEVRNQALQQLQGDFQESRVPLKRSSSDEESGRVKKSKCELLEASPDHKILLETLNQLKLFGQVTANEVALKTIGVFMGNHQRWTSELQAQFVYFFVTFQRQLPKDIKLEEVKEIYQLVCRLCEHLILPVDPAFDEALFTFLDMFDQSDRGYILTRIAMRRHLPVILLQDFFINPSVTVQEWSYFCRGMALYLRPRARSFEETLTNIHTNHNNSGRVLGELDKNSVISFIGKIQQFNCDRLAFINACYFLRSLSGSIPDEVFIAIFQKWSQLPSHSQSNAAMFFHHYYRSGPLFSFCKQNPALQESLLRLYSWLAETENEIDVSILELSLKNCVRLFKQENAIGVKRALFIKLCNKIEVSPQITTQIFKTFCTVFAPSSVALRERFFSIDRMCEISYLHKKKSNFFEGEAYHALVTILIDLYNAPFDLSLNNKILELLVGAQLSRATPHFWSFLKKQIDHDQLESADFDTALTCCALMVLDLSPERVYDYKTLLVQLLDRAIQANANKTYVTALLYAMQKLRGQLLFSDELLMKIYTFYRITDEEITAHDVGPLLQNCALLSAFKDPGPFDDRDRQLIIPIFRTVCTFNQDVEDDTHVTTEDLVFRLISDTAEIMSQIDPDANESNLDLYKIDLIFEALGNFIEHSYIKEGKSMKKLPPLTEQICEKLSSMLEFFLTLDFPRFENRNFMTSRVITGIGKIAKSQGISIFQDDHEFAFYSAFLKENLMTLEALSYLVSILPKDEFFMTIPLLIKILLQESEFEFQSAQEVLIRLASCGIVPNFTVEEEQSLYVCIEKALKSSKAKPIELSVLINNVKVLIHHQWFADSQKIFNLLSIFERHLLNSLHYRELTGQRK